MIRAPEPIAGQLNAAERRVLTDAVLCALRKPNVVLEVGTWLGGGSTLHLLRALEQSAAGHLWGIEADQSIYEAMLANINAAAPDAKHRFTPILGLSQDVLPRWLMEQGGRSVDLAFLDGGDNPMEQVREFQLLDPHMPVGSLLLSHDAKLRKGKWLVPYLSALDHWEGELLDISDEGLFRARKLRAQPSPESVTRAGKVLRRLRYDLPELVGAFLPSSAIRFLLRFLPMDLVRSITQGRRAAR